MMALNQIRSGIALDLIDDTDDGRIYRCARTARRRCGSGPAFANHDDKVTYSGIYCVQSQQFIAPVRTIRIGRTDDHDPAAFVSVVFLRSYDVADDPREDHTI
jgi:hypothetical protein